MMPNFCRFLSLTGAMLLSMLADRATLPGMGRIPPNNETKKTTIFLD
jgi:hypothetical protein